MTKENTNAKKEIKCKCTSLFLEITKNVNTFKFNYGRFEKVLLLYGELKGYYCVIQSINNISAMGIVQNKFFSVKDDLYKEIVRIAQTRESNNV